MSSPLRVFLPAALPSVVWLVEERVTTAQWRLPTGWTVRLLRSRSRYADLGRLVLDPPGPAGPHVVELAGGLEGAPSWLGAFVADHPASTADSTRRGCMIDGTWWQVDEHHDRDGLLVAATGMVAPARRPVEIPAWAGREVTGDPAYAVGGADEADEAGEVGGGAGACSTLLS